MVEIRKQVKTTNQNNKNNTNWKSGGSQRPKVQIILKGSQAASQPKLELELPVAWRRTRSVRRLRGWRSFWPRLPAQDQTHFEKGQHEIPGESLTRRLRLVTFLGKVFVESWTVTEFCRFCFFFFKEYVFFFIFCNLQSSQVGLGGAIRWRRAEQTSFVGGAVASGR